MKQRTTSLTRDQQLGGLRIRLKEGWETDAFEGYLRLCRRTSARPCGCISWKATRSMKLQPSLVSHEGISSTTIFGVWRDCERRFLVANCTTGEHYDEASCPTWERGIEVMGWFVRRSLRRQKAHPLSSVEIEVVPGR